MFNQPEFGKIICLEGDKATTATVLISLAMKLQKQEKVLFIDVADCFNPSFVQKSYQQSTQLALENIMIARPFTAEQLRNILLNIKENITEERVLIIPSIDQFFYDEELTDLEAHYMFKLIMIELEILTQKHKISTLISFSHEETKRKKELQEIAMRRTSFWSKV